MPTPKFDIFAGLLLEKQSGALSFANLAGNPYDNNALSNALNQKNDRLVAGEGIDISDILHTTLDVEKTGSFTIQNNYDGTKSTVGVEKKTLTYSLEGWLDEDGTEVNLEDYQLEITSGMPSDGDTLVLTYTTIDTMTESVSVKQWTGTQAQYEVLGTYEAGVDYRIIEG